MRPPTALHENSVLDPSVGHIVHHDLRVLPRDQRRRRRSAARCPVVEITHGASAEPLGGIRGVGRAQGGRYAVFVYGGRHDGFGARRVEPIVIPFIGATGGGTPRSVSSRKQSNAMGGTDPPGHIAQMRITRNPDASQILGGPGDLVGVVNQIAGSGVHGPGQAPQMIIGSCCQPGDHLRGSLGESVGLGRQRSQLGRHGFWLRRLRHDRPCLRIREKCLPDPFVRRQ